MSLPPPPPMPPTSSAPASPEDAFADVPNFTQGPPSSSAASSDDDGFGDASEPLKFVEKPMPCGIRSAYVADVRLLPPKDDKAARIVVNVQVSDVEFPPKKGTNDPVPLWIGLDEPAKAKRVLKALGVAPTSDPFDKNVWRSLKNKPCRVFVSVWNDKLQIPLGAPNPKNRKDSDKQFWANVDAQQLGTNDELSKKFYDQYCGLWPAE